MPTVVDKVRARITGNDAERFAKRREIKRRLAELAALAGRQRAIGVQIRGLNTREEAAVSKHQRTCEPLQKRLEEIEVGVTSAILADEPVSDELAKQRAEVLDKLAAANAGLEAEVSTLKKLRRQLQAKMGGLFNSTREISRLRGQLAARGVADPQLLLDRFVNTQERHWVDRRLTAARDELQKVNALFETAKRYRLDYPAVRTMGEPRQDEQPSESERELSAEAEQWAAEVQAAEAALADAVQKQDAIRQAIIDE